MFFPNTLSFDLEERISQLPGGRFLSSSNIDELEFCFLDQKMRARIVL